ncbi:MAG: isoleucine--tRNA ligase [Patescibacteria group bacterium]
MDFVDLEQQILRSWRSGDVLEQSLKKTTKKRPFIFYEGPPSANAKPGIHHVLARSFKDLILRFNAMQGYQVERRAGWDTHGLPIEVQAEKELGLKSKKDIEAYGVAKFNAYCRELVFRYQKDWEALTERIGFWLDLKNPYITYESSYISELWGIIKQFHEKGLLYKGYKVVPHCPRCGTSLSSHEVAQGYEDVTEESVYVKFKILDGAYKDTSIVAWTTTPWTLPGNVALAVGKDIAYVKVGDLIMAKSSDTSEDTSEVGTGGTSVQSVDVNKLIGSHYEPLYPFLAGKAKDVHTIIDADFVSTDEGTGIVHTAVMYGEDDYKLADRFDLPKIHTVDDDGTFKDFVKPFAGKFVKDADRDIIKDLKDRGLLLKAENYTHSYPFCWRCGTPLLYYAKDSWFVAMSTLRKELVANNNKITWTPAHLKQGRFGEFLKEAKDWAFSRERYWGTPLPVWMCKNGHTKVIGSVTELPKKLDDLHRPLIDEIIFECSECNETMHREPYVVDGWFDSGAMPYASGEQKAGRFPADFIAEGIDQTRGWFYTLLAVSTALGDGPPYKTVISNGLVLDEKGKKMSKSKGNVIDPNTIIEKHGADALRWYFYIMNQPGDNKAFVEKDLVTYKNKTLGLLWNVYAYYETYSRMQKSKIKDQTDKSKFKILDQWITSRLHVTINHVTNQLERYEITEAAREIMALIDDTSTWYVRRSRGRTDEAFFATLKNVLETTAKLIAPFMPFNADALHLEFGKESVHLQDWPKADKKMIDQKLIADTLLVRTIVSEALKLRSASGIKVRQPLKQLTINNSALKDFHELITDELNVKKIVVGRGVALDTKITPELREEGIARDVIRAIQDLRKQAGYGFSDQVAAFYETADQKTNQALGVHRTMIESETLTSLQQGIPHVFDKEFSTETLRLAVSKRR